MRRTGRRTLALVLALSALLGGISAGIPPIVHAVESYKVQAFPFYSQEGSGITLILGVSASNPSTLYQFNFIVQDPSNTNCTSMVQHSTGPTETEFSINIAFPGPGFSGSCSPTALVGTYRVYVDQLLPVVKRNVNPTVFYIGLVDSLFAYQRTQTVGIRAIGYRPGETTTVSIRTTSSLTLVFTNSTTASSTGVVTSSWKIPRNATVVQSYLVSVSGTSTAKSPSDAQVFFVQAAVITIPSLTSTQSAYQRTQTFSFSFQSTYPDGSYANTGVALITLIRPSGTNITLTTSFDSTSQRFVATYKTSTTNQTGTWAATLTHNSYDDGNGNIGPSIAISTSAQLQPATLTVAIASQSSYALNQQIKFNTTISYPDGTNFQTGSVSSFLVFSGGGHNDSVPISFDSTFQKWVASYTPGVNEPGGLWSLRVVAADSAIPTNYGSATRAVTLQDRPPFAIFTPSPTTALTGITISFVGTASYDPDGTVVSYSWDFGDGSTASGATASHSYSIAGNYTASLTVTDNSGSTASNTALIIIQDRPPTAIITVPTGTTSAGQSASFSAAGTVDPDGTISTYAWNFGDGSTGTGFSASHTYSNPGTYTVTLTVTDNSVNIGSTTSRITIGAASSSSGNASFPLYYFGILVAVIAAMLAGGFMYFRRHRVTHARLKIDLEAVKSEAGRIENQEFFQSVKDQLKKDKDD
jgi:PKD repeat protein